MTGLLLRLAGMEAIFEKSTDDVEEKGRRDKLLRYAIVPPLDRVLTFYIFHRVLKRAGEVLLV